MNHPLTVRNAEVTIVGLTFIVDYTYYPAISETEVNPGESASVEFLRVGVKGQLEADAGELLCSIKAGYALLADEIIKIHQES